MGNLSAKDLRRSTPFCLGPHGGCGGIFAGDTVGVFSVLGNGMVWFFGEFFKGSVYLYALLLSLRQG